jgi:uncharacterized protein (TIGR00369 family)
MEFVDDNKCLLCGSDNPDGLNLSFETSGDSTSTKVNFPEKYQGYRKIVHGGMIAAVLDEVMIKHIYSAGYVTVTAELTTKFLKPAPTETELVATAFDLRMHGKIITIQGDMKTADGTVVAESSGKYLVLSHLAL